jgi:preprotein translocase subunit SecG
MTFIIGILTVVMVLNCVLLILLVLVQLPKKDTGGAGLAFGGGAADALFGAGSGNALTKVTKYAAVIFFGLALLLGYLQNQLQGGNTASEFEKQVQQQQQQQVPPTQPPMNAPAQTPSATPVVPATTTGGSNLLAVPLAPATNAPQK